MGIYIKGMEMPKKDNGAVLIIYPDGSCVFEDGERYQVMEIPQHGDLIDADYLNMEYAETNEDGEWVILCDALCEVPVIIPAEPPKGET